MAIQLTVAVDSHVNEEEKRNLQLVYRGMAAITSHALVVAAVVTEREPLDTIMATAQLFLALVFPHDHKDRHSNHHHHKQQCRRSTTSSLKNKTKGIPLVIATNTIPWTSGKSTRPIGRFNLLGRAIGIRLADIHLLTARGNGVIGIRLQAGGEGLQLGVQAHESVHHIQSHQRHIVGHHMRRIVDQHVGQVLGLLPFSCGFLFNFPSNRPSVLLLKC